MTITDFTTYPAIDMGEIPGAAAYQRLDRIHCQHGLEDLDNPFATGLLDLPDPGGYALLAVLEDGELLCEACLRNPDNPVHPGDYGDGWGVCGFITNESADDEQCAHCHKNLEASHA